MDKLTQIYDGMLVERDGCTFLINIVRDDDATPPWERQGGCGTVTDWVARDKRPSELVLVRSARQKSARYYDFAETMRRAKDEGWELCENDKHKLAKKLGREPNEGEARAEAVRRDYEFLRGWCNDEWCYVGVIVSEVNEGSQAALWGIESNDVSYLAEVAEVVGVMQKKREKREEVACKAKALEEIVIKAREVVECAYTPWKEQGDLDEATRRLNAAVRNLSGALRTYDEGGQHAKVPN